MLRIYVLCQKIRDQPSVWMGFPGTSRAHNELASQIRDKRMAIK